MHKYQLDTPCLVIDKTKLMTNLRNMQNEVTAANKVMRPHIKTHKCTQIAQYQIDQGAFGVSAAKLGEVEQLVNLQIPGILITSPVVTPTKIKRLMACVRFAHDICVVTDSQQNALALSQAAVASNIHLNVLVDVDPGVGRTGIAYDKAGALAYMVDDLPNLNFWGLQCYAGNLQHIADFKERELASCNVMKEAAKVAKDIAKAGIACPILSGSGTGTYDIDMKVPEVTEVQPGSYTVMDREYQLIGSRENKHKLTRFQPAMTMLVTVISANHDTHVTVDAGTKSLYFDANTKPKIVSHKGLHYDWSVFGDEHGKVTADPGVPLPQVGEVIELIVPHCDPTINLFDCFYITENDEVIDTWLIDMRGKSA